MHRRTFDVLKGGEVVTVWAQGPHHGLRGTVIRTRGFAIVIRLDAGDETTERYQDVAMGDNSFARYPPEQ